MTLVVSPQPPPALTSDVSAKLWRRPHWDKLSAWEVVKRASRFTTVNAL